MWNPENHLIKFVPETEWTDPSYHLPHFYEVFAQRADEADRPFWREAAAASRRYLVPPAIRKPAEPRIHKLRGTPHVDDRPLAFLLRAYAPPATSGCCLRNGVVPELCDANARQDLLGHDRTCVYAIDGTPVDEGMSYA